MTHPLCHPPCATRPVQPVATACSAAPRPFRWLASIAAIFCLASATAASLNDTGQTLCYNASDVGVPCSAAVGGDNGVNPRQDGRYGRDAAAAAGQLTKIGAGSAGFDYTKIANNGSTLPATATLGAGPTDWACTKDNVTGLIWEVKTSSGLRSSAHTYTWYSTDTTSNGGVAGAVGTNTCGASLAAAPYNNQCNTQNFVLAVNATGLCGASDWRLPSLRNLWSIYIPNSGVQPNVDSAYFPNTELQIYWSRTTDAFAATTARIVHFGGGYTIGYDKTGSTPARLVRGGL
jgi:hypothetical protein